MNKQLLDLYSDYLISSFGQTTAIGLSELLDGTVSYDKISRFLADGAYTFKKLWVTGKAYYQANRVRSGGFDRDTIQEKEHSAE